MFEAAHEITLVLAVCGPAELTKLASKLSPFQLIYVILIVLALTLLIGEMIAGRRTFAQLGAFLLMAVVVGAPIFLL